MSKRLTRNDPRKVGGDAWYYLENGWLDFYTKASAVGVSRMKLTAATLRRMLRDASSSPKQRVATRGGKSARRTTGGGRV